MAQQVSLLDHIKVLLDERDKRWECRQDAHEKADLAAQAAQERAIDIAGKANVDAVAKAFAVLDRRFDAVNEFRGMLEDREGSYAKADVVEAEFRSLRASIERLNDALTLGTGRGIGVQQAWGYLAGAVAMTAAVSGMIMLLFGR